MDTLDLSEEIKHFQHNGVSLNLDERMQIEMALNTLQSKSECEELQFWGKINGLKNDYYIAVAIRYRDMFEFPVKTFYWALSTDFEFKEMPSLTSQHNEVINADNTYFMGEPAKMLVQVNKPGDGEGEEEAKEEVEDEEGQEAKAAASDETEEEEIKVPQRDLTEVDRLATVVHAIENDCQLCPLGAFKMTADHQVRRNEAFRGLCGADALKLSNFLHFRNVQTEQKKKDLDLPTAPFNPNFLESACEDQPKGCWNLIQDDRKETVIIRSLKWPGYQFYHKQASDKFGSFYCGDGLKNLELHFIIQ